MDVFIKIGDTGINGNYGHVYIEARGSTPQEMLNNALAGGYAVNRGNYSIPMNKFFRLAIFQVVKLMASYTIENNSIVQDMGESK